jgi:hypothetical protein
MALVVGEELQVAQISELEGTTIVDKFCGRWISLKSVNMWMEKE